MDKKTNIHLVDKWRRILTVWLTYTVQKKRIDSQTFWLPDGEKD
jgi:hypothetical protein